MAGQGSHSNPFGYLGGKGGICIHPVLQTMKANAVQVGRTY